MDDCKYCSLNENGDIPADTQDILFEQFWLDGPCKVQIGTAGGGDFGIMISEKYLFDDKVILEKLLRFEYCPMCGRKLHED